MMKTILDSETELGTCDPDYAPEPSARNGQGGEETGWTIYAHSKASLTNTRGMLKIEQRCFIRQGQDVLDHPAVKPEFFLETAPETEAECLAQAQKTHLQFIERARREISENSRAGDRLVQSF